MSTKLTASRGGWTIPSVLAQGLCSAREAEQDPVSGCLGAKWAGEAAGTGALTWVNNACAVL